jgi:hypothetical protein
MSVRVIRHPTKQNGWRRSQYPTTTIKIYPPTRATKEDEVVSNPDPDGLLEFLLGFAQKMLPAQSSFSPFGATVTDDS